MPLAPSSPPARRSFDVCHDMHACMPCCSPPPLCPQVEEVRLQPVADIEQEIKARREHERRTGERAGQARGLPCVVRALLMTACWGCPPGCIKQQAYTCSYRGLLFAPQGLWMPYTGGP